MTCLRNSIIFLTIIMLIIGFVYISNARLICTGEGPLNGIHECSCLWVHFKGEFKNSKREGYGELKSDYLEFKGNWKNDKRNGKGVVQFFSNFHEDEGKIEGNWENDFVVGEAIISSKLYNYNITYKGDSKSFLMNNKGTLKFYKKNNDKMLYGKLKGYFNNGHLLSNETHPSYLIIYTTEKKNKKIQPLKKKFKILKFKDSWSLSYNYQCESKILNLNTNDIYQWNGNKLKSETQTQTQSQTQSQIGIEIIFENLKRFELFWLTKSLLVQRENIPIYQLKTEL
eukprot:gene10816-3434_t